MKESSSLLLQNIAVAAILLACIAWMIISVLRRFKNKGRRSNCSGCTLSQHCVKEPRKRRKSCFE